jgi:hypothetical protein
MSKEFSKVPGDSGKKGWTLKGEVFPDPTSEIALISKMKESHTTYESHQPAGEQLAALQGKVDRISDALNDVEECFKQNKGEWKSIALESGLSERFIESLIEALNDFTNDLQRFAGPTGTGTPADGLIIVTSAAAIHGDLDDIGKSAATSSSSRIKGWLDWIMKRWHEATRWLQVVISRMMTPREWSISGGVGILGWANASLSITFGE